MTPAEAAREVANEAEARWRETDDEHASVSWHAVMTAMSLFAKLLEGAESAPEPDGLFERWVAAGRP